MGNAGAGGGNTAPPNPDAYPGFNGGDSPTKTGGAIVQILSANGGDGGDADPGEGGAGGAGIQMVMVRADIPAISPEACLESATGSWATQSGHRGRNLDQARMQWQRLRAVALAGDAQRALVHVDVFAANFGDLVHTQASQRCEQDHRPRFLAHVRCQECPQLRIAKGLRCGLWHPAAATARSS